MVSTREMKKFVWRLLQRYLKHRQIKGSGVYLDVAHRYWLLTPAFLRNDGTVPTGFAEGQAVLDWLSVHVPMDLSARVLDVGCGDGRVGGALARLGSAFTGQYCAFDIDRGRIHQLKRLFALRPQFEFHYADVYHPIWNSGARTQAQDYVYPYGDRSFDVIFYNSIFTHLPLAALHSNLKEAVRCLDRGGRIWASFYCLDEDYSVSTSTRKFTTPYDEGFTSTPSLPMSCVGYSKDTICRVFGRLDLAVVRYVSGYWKKTRISLDQHEQDVFVLSCRT